MLRGWQKRRISAANVGQYFNGMRKNIGILLGEPSDGLTDVDLDCSEALGLADRFLPSTSSIFGRAAKPPSHRLYIVSAATSLRFADPGGGMLLELRSTGAMTIFPGSVYPSGEAIEWESDGEPARAREPELVAACAELATACLVLRYIGQDAIELLSERWPELLGSVDPRLGSVTRQWLCHTVTPGENAGVTGKSEQNQCCNIRHTCHTSKINGYDPSEGDAAQHEGIIPTAARAYALAALKGEAEIVASIEPGSQGNALNAAARKLAEFVTAGTLAEDEVREALSAAGEQMHGDHAREPWTLEQIAATIESGLTAGKPHPPRDLSGIGKAAKARITAKPKGSSRTPNGKEAPPTADGAGSEAAAGGGGGGRPDEILRTLLREGLDIAAAPEQRQHLISYLASVKVRDRVRCVSRVGWHHAAVGSGFVLPDVTFSAGFGCPRLLLQTEQRRDTAYKSAGTREGWRREIGERCIGNSRLTFAVSAPSQVRCLISWGIKAADFISSETASPGKPRHYVLPAAFGAAVTIVVT